MNSIAGEAKSSTGNRLAINSIFALHRLRSRFKNFHLAFENYVYRMPQKNASQQQLNWETQS
jgi:hypothetical protein